MRVIVAPEDPAQMAQKPPPDDADVVLVLTSLDPAFGTEQLASWVTDAVMILCPSGGQPHPHAGRPGNAP